MGMIQKNPNIIFKSQNKVLDYGQALVKTVM
jgi:hypothetical protein